MNGSWNINLDNGDIVRPGRDANNDQPAKNESASDDSSYHFCTQINTLPKLLPLLYRQGQAKLKLVFSLLYQNL